MSKFSQLFMLSFLVSFLLTCFSGATYAKVYEFTEGNKLTLLPDARAAVELKLNLVRQAKNHIHIMTYYWDNEGYPMDLIKELKKARERGVDIRIMTTYTPTLTKDFWGKTKKEFFNDLDNSPSKAILGFVRLLPGNHQSFTNNIHEKVFIVDGQKAIIGGRNISEDDFYSKDLEVMLEGSIVNQVQEHFKKMFSFLIDLKIEDKCTKGNLGCHAKYNKLKIPENDQRFFPTQFYFVGGARARIITNELLIDQHLNDFKGDARFKARDDIINAITQIQFSKMRAYNYFIIPTERYKFFLEKNLAEGKSIDIMTNSLNTSGAISNKGYIYSLPEMHNLVNRGLNLHQWLGVGQGNGKNKLFYLHQKVMLFDEDRGIIGSHNFGAASTSVSSEIVVDFFSKEVVQILCDIFDNETQSSELTKEATLPMLESEIHDHRKMIHFLHNGLIENLIKMLY